MNVAQDPWGREKSYTTCQLKAAVAVLKKADLQKPYDPCHISGHSGCVCTVKLQKCIVY